MAYDEATAEEQLPLAAGDELKTGLICTPWLPADVTVSSVGDVTVADDRGGVASLTIQNAQPNGSTYTSRAGNEYDVGQVVTYTASGATAGRFYTVSFPLTFSNGDVLMARQVIKGI